MRDFLKEYWSCLLFLTTILGLIDKSLCNYIITIVAVFGLYTLCKNYRMIIKDPFFKGFSLIFLCIWLPMLVSFVDAVNITHSAQTVFPFIRFYFCGIFIIYAISKSERQIDFIITSIFYITIFWCAVAIICFCLAENPSFDMIKTVLEVFHPKTASSHMCAVLSVFCLFYAFSKKNSVLLNVSVIVLLVYSVFLGGRRAAWLMLILAVLFSFLYYYFYGNQKHIKSIIYSSLICFGLIFLTNTLNQELYERTKVIFNVFSNDYEKTNEAVSKRLPLWSVSYIIFQKNPINGIAPRGFRHVYADHAKKDDIFLTRNNMPTHPHLFFLEILVETGLIGFICYIFMLIYLLWIFIKTLPQKKQTFFLFLPVMIALFPFNAHMAFYGSFWSSIIWLLIALLFANLRNKALINK